MAVNASRVITLTAKPTATGTISNVANATATNNDTKVSDTDVVNIFVVRGRWHADQLACMLALLPHAHPLPCYVCSLSPRAAP